MSSNSIRSYQNFETISSCLTLRSFKVSNNPFLLSTYPPTKSSYPLYILSLLPKLKELDGVVREEILEREWVNEEEEEEEHKTGIRRNEGMVDQINALQKIISVQEEALVGGETESGVHLVLEGWRRELFGSLVREENEKRMRNTLQASLNLANQNQDRTNKETKVWKEEVGRLRETVRSVSRQV